MTTTLRERAEHAAKYGANLIVPATEIKAILDERDTLTAAHEAMEAERDHERSRVERYIAAHHTISDQLVGMRAERDAALARIERVRGVHAPVEVEPSETICRGCSTERPGGRFFPYAEYPCATIRALDGGEEGT